MIEAPNIKEALEDLQHFSDTQLDHNPKMQKVVATVIAALATLQPSGERREAIARIIYDAFPFDPPCEFHPETGERVLKPAWIDRGNSFRQDDARRAADKILASGLVQDEAANGNRALPYDRDQLGRFVREAWVRWAETQPNPKPSWLLPYDDLGEPDKEADRQIGEAVARWALIGDAAIRSARNGGAS